MRPDINELTADNKYVYATILHEKSFGIYAYDKNTGAERWRYVDDLPGFYLMADLSSVYYQEKIFLPFNEKIIYLNREDGRVLGEYNIEDIDQITTFNQSGLNGNNLTFIIEDLDYELLTIDLDSGELVDRQLIEHDSPSIVLNYNEHIFDIDNFGRRLSAYSVYGNNRVSFDWEKNYNQPVSLFGQDNGLLYLFDKADNSIFSITTSAGKIVNNRLPLLWPGLDLKIYNDYIIVQSDGHLYVIKNI